MAKMVEITCKCGCGRKRMVRQVDINRGWGIYFSKSCKATHQERKTGQYKNFMTRKSDLKINATSDDLDSISDGNGGNFSNEDYFDGYGFGAKDY